jgi:hypothetical protein
MEKIPVQAYDLLIPTEMGIEAMGESLGPETTVMITEVFREGSVQGMVTAESRNPDFIIIPSEFLTLEFFTVIHGPV